ncbi:MAG: N-acetyltransferase [Candidatus Lokiarchaeota archaeon]|nr:N-acetyltransferase [Candidatus Lokiarchaeota archaeon]
MQDIISIIIKIHFNNERYSIRRSYYLSGTPDFKKIIILSDGSKVLIRPIKPEDALLIIKLYESFSDETRYLRFFTRRKSMTLEEAKKYANVNYLKDFALVAQIPDKDELICVARYFRSEDGSRAEIAVVVTDRWQYKTLGTQISEILLEFAKKNGIKTIYGEVLASNIAIRKIMAESGFDIKKTYEDGILYFEFNI